MKIVMTLIIFIYMLLLSSCIQPVFNVDQHLNLNKIEWSESMYPQTLDPLQFQIKSEHDLYFYLYINSSNTPQVIKDNLYLVYLSVIIDPTYVTNCSSKEDYTCMNNLSSFLYEQKVSVYDLVHQGIIVLSLPTSIVHFEAIYELKSIHIRFHNDHALPLNAVEQEGIVNTIREIKDQTSIMVSKTSYSEEEIESIFNK